MNPEINLEEYEKIYLAYLRQNPSLTKNVNSLYFKNEKIGVLFKIFSRYFKKYGTRPTNKQLWSLVASTDFKDKISIDEFKAIVKVDLKEYDSQWLDKSFDTWIGTKGLESGVRDVIEYLRDVTINEDNVTNVIQNVKTLINDRTTLNFRFNEGLDFFDPAHHEQETEEDKVSTGFENVDRILGGGLSEGTITAFMGESNVGKSIFLANLAANAVINGHNVVYITAEMKDRKVVKRLGANLLNVDMKNYETFAKDPARVKKRLQSLNTGLMPPGRLFVKEYPTSQATVHDIEGYLAELEESIGEKIKFVLIDYINILENYRNPNSENTYLKIKNLAEDLRAIMQRRGYIGATVTQVSGTGIGSSDLTARDVSESKALYHTVDNLFGIIQTPEMLQEQKYYLKSLKLRDSGGKYTKIGMTIDYNFMKIQENGEMIVATG